MTRRRKLVGLVAVAGLVVLAAACSDDAPRPELATGGGRSVESRGPGAPGSGAHGPGEERSAGGGYGRQAADSGGEASTTPATSEDVSAEESERAVADPAELTEADVDGLLWMREEEQLAHDVYVALGEQWGSRVFENIAASERGHIDRVVALLDAFAIDDPMMDQPAGSFTIPELQMLHDELVADGSATVVAALSVAALIEETDIADLRELAAATDVDAIADAYARLERGSRNHLRAFTTQLEAQGVTYESTVLAPTDYDEIVSAPMERGRDGKGRRDH